jgi:hypothetical protein
MKLFYLQAEYLPGKHRIAAAVYDADLFRFDEGTLSAFDTLEIDEVDPDNKALCLDLARTVNRADEAGEPNYHVNGSGELMEKEGWQEASYPEDYNG